MKKQLLTLACILTMFSVLAAPVFANNHEPSIDASNTANTDGSNTPKTDGSNQTSKTTGVAFKLDNPFKQGVGNNLYDLLKAIVNNIILPIGGVLCVLAFIYSGFLYVMARGNENDIEKAHRALLYTAIGTALLLGAWVFANVIKNTVDQLM